MGHVILNVMWPARVLGSSKRNTIEPLERRRSFMPTLHVGVVRKRASCSSVMLCCAVMLLELASQCSSVANTHMRQLKAPRYQSHAPHYRDTPLASLV
jgi:hypothetical protein